MKKIYKIIISIIIAVLINIDTINCQYTQDLVNISKISIFPQDYNHKIYAGFLNITSYGKSLYFMFFQSQSNPDNDPVILWLNGGPGCSSMIGMTTQHGPFLFTPGTDKMVINQNSWNKQASVIYLESPPGVGFSYASDKYMATTDTQTAKDNLQALILFFQRFKKFSGNDFYLAGQSYAGIYVPMLAKQILDFNLGTNQLKINLRGMLLGNPCTHMFQCLTQTVQSRYFSQFLYSHGFLEKTTYNDYVAQCISNEYSPTCIRLQTQIYNLFLNSGANIYNVYGTCYYPKYPSQFQPLAGQQKMKKFQQKIKNNLKHPLRCSDALGSLTLFNNNQFRQGLKVYVTNDTLAWSPCSDDLDYTIDVGETFSLLPDLVKSGIKIIYYSGDQDAIVSTQGTKWWVQQYRNQFGAAVKRSWRPWIVPGQKSLGISGMVWQLQGLTFVTVIGAGHMVPTDKPVEAAQILRHLLTQAKWQVPDYYQE